VLFDATSRTGGSVGRGESEQRCLDVSVGVPQGHNQIPQSMTGWGTMPLKQPLGLQLLYSPFFPSCCYSPFSLRSSHTHTTNRTIITRRTTYSLSHSLTASPYHLFLAPTVSCYLDTDLLTYLLISNHTLTTVPACCCSFLRVCVRVCVSIHHTIPFSFGGAPSYVPTIALIV
jgi:hypothetical protein